MKLTLQKLHIVLLQTEDKLASFTGNFRVHQNSIEKIVQLHTQMRAEKEQCINKLLFNNL